MKKEYIGINPLKVEGSRFETGYGYSDSVKLIMNNKKLTPIISASANTWGVKNHEDRTSENVYVKIEDKGKFLSFYSKAKKFEINNPFIVSYGSIKIGEGVWGPSSGFKLGKIRDYKKINVYNKWNFKVKKGFSNFTYDIWLSKKEKGPLEDEDIEIMVWLDYNFTPPYETLFENDKFVVKYKKKPKKGKLGGYRFDYYVKGNPKKISFDLIDLLKVCDTKIKNIGKYYMRVIELGPEISVDSEVSIKLYDLTMEFERKR